MDAPRLAVQTDFPLAFHCTSGELLFGQLQCILEGSNHASHDAMTGPTRLPQGGGTIKQNKFKHRAAARSGRWSVSRIYLANRDQPQPGGHTDTYNAKQRLVGYVLHHEDVSPVEYVLRAAKVGMSDLNQHPDRGIVYINRYDWSWHHGEHYGINVALGPTRSYSVSQVKDLMGGRLIVLDASHTQTFIDTIKTSYPERKCYTLHASSTPGPYGVHLDTAGNFPEYELGWLGFSGRKHEMFPESDELVAIVYDPAYTGFMPDYVYPECVVKVEGTVVVTGETLAANLEGEEDDEDYVPESESESESDDSDKDEESESQDTQLEANELASLALPDTLPAPTITSVVPDPDPGQQHRISISGSTLGQITSISFTSASLPSPSPSASASAFTIKSNTLLSALVPAGLSGPISVTVSGPGGTSTPRTYVQPPLAHIASVTPNHGSRWGGESVTITGHHLDRTTQVTFGSQPALALDLISPTELKVTTPAGPGGTRFSGASRYCRVEVKLESDAYEVATGGPEHMYFVYQYGPDVPAGDPPYDAALKTWRAAVARARDAGDVAACESLAEVLEKKGDRAGRIAVWVDALESGVVGGRRWATSRGRMRMRGDVFLGMADAYEKMGREEMALRMRNEAARMWHEPENIYY
ncbi:hypothetical protein LshimejAT787_1102300 [Lyophyllum shimeji]|uniref:IPT/TIG domain-containing protein n=1 Tax=Lyophyllum shimeji TaxID=47721 RepID=A0A9P3PUH0_LYOSH|nr:hypothetical protein LshimejAT787_1102300 [Lyophyllum shimeji]